MQLSNGVYDFFMFIAQIFLPAAGTAYFALAGIWGLPSAEQVVGSIVVVDTFLGVILKAFNSKYEAPVDGHVLVDNTDEQGAQLRFVLDKELDSIHHGDTFKLKVQDSPKHAAT